MTLVLSVDPLKPAAEAIRQAADVILSGGLVAFPTETVYGLGANALNPQAVARIFEAKGRPATNPLIVHVADTDSVLNVVTEWPETAVRLTARFWPGPLTIVTSRHTVVPDMVTAGGSTVAVRCPAHPVARELIRIAGVPIAAPSANRSAELSPTRAQHVLRGLNDRIAMVLDGGACPCGIESTVVDVTGTVVRLLRPGVITVPMLEEVVGGVVVGPGHEIVARSPGLMTKHYSPRTPIRLCTDEYPMGVSDISWRAGKKWGFVHFLGSAGPSVNGVVLRGLSENPQSAAADLFEALHSLDEAELDGIAIIMPPDTPEWAGVRDRLIRAAAEP